MYTAPPKPLTACGGKGKKEQYKKKKNNKRKKKKRYVNHIITP
jgi:hypothetical protein